MDVKLKVIKTEIVTPKPPCHEHWLPFTNLDLVVPPIDTGSFLFYKKPIKKVDVTKIISNLKISLSRALALYYPLAGQVKANMGSELGIYCNNRGVVFIEATADVELGELNFYKMDSNARGELMPKRRRGVLAVQVTMLKCGGMVLACLFDHRVVDGYSINLFTHSWANMIGTNISQPPILIPNFRRSDLSARHQRTYTPYVANMYIPLSNLRLPQTNSGSPYQDALTNQIYYMKGDQIKRLQGLASANGCQMSQMESVASFLWKTTASFLEDSGHTGYMCNLVIPMDGRQRLSEGEGIEKEKQMGERCGNVFSMPFIGIKSKDLKDMPLSRVANEVHELLESTSTKEHFKELIDWVEEQRPKPLISRPLAENEKGVSIMVTLGVKFLLKGNKDFGMGKPAFVSCHVPAARWDWHVMLLPSPVNEDDWIVYMHLPKKHLNYVEAHASHLFKPLTAPYLNLVLNHCVARM